MTEGLKIVRLCEIQSQRSPTVQGIGSNSTKAKAINPKAIISKHPKHPDPTCKLVV